MLQTLVWTFEWIRQMNSRLPEEFFNQVNKLKSVCGNTYAGDNEE